MEALGDVIRLSTRQGAKDALDVVGVDEKTDNMLIIDLDCKEGTSKRYRQGKKPSSLHLALRVRLDAYACNHHW